MFWVGPLGYDVLSVIDAKCFNQKTMLGTSWGWFFQSGNWLPSKASSKDWKFPFANFGGRFHHFRVDKIWQLINWRRLWMKTCYSFIQLYTVYFKWKVTTVAYIKMTLFLVTTFWVMTCTPHDLRKIPQADPHVKESMNYGNDPEDQIFLWLFS